MIGTSAYNVGTSFWAVWLNLGVWRVSKEASRSQVSTGAERSCEPTGVFYSSCLFAQVLFLAVIFELLQEFNEKLCFSINLILSANLSQKPLFKPVPQKNTFAAFVWYRLVNEHLHSNVVSTLSFPGKNPIWILWIMLLLARNSNTSFLRMLIKCFCDAQGQMHFDFCALRVVGSPERVRLWGQLGGTPSPTPTIRFGVNFR